MSEPKKRCPKGMRRNKAGECVPVAAKNKESMIPSPILAEPVAPIIEMEEDIREKKTELEAQAEMPQTKAKTKRVIKSKKVKSPVKSVSLKSKEKDKEAENENIVFAKVLSSETIEFPPLSSGKCPRGTRKLKGRCVLNKEFKETYVKRRACIRSQRNKL